MHEDGRMGIGACQFWCPRVMHVVTLVAVEYQTYKYRSDHEERLIRLNCVVETTVASISLTGMWGHGSV